jgi:serine/threonine-protein kinase
VNDSSRAGVDSLADFANYKLVSLLAAGGMAELYLAWQLGPSGFKRQVVIKRPHPHLATDPEFLSLFVREASIAAGLSHENIVAVYEVLQPAPGDYALALEYVPGDNLRGLRLALQSRDQLLGTGLALHIACCVCDALEYAYSHPGPDMSPRRIVHRDVSPSNILLSTAGEVKLTDFGLARAYTGESTKSTVLRGKATYMAPEQIRGATLDQRADLFSLAIVLYELTTGTSPFKRDSEVATSHAVLHDPIPPPRELRGDYPADLETVLLRCLERDPDRRHGSARELAGALRACADALPTATASSELAALAQQLSPQLPPGESTRHSWPGNPSSSRQTLVTSLSRHSAASTPSSARSGPGVTPAPPPRSSAAAPAAMAWHWHWWLGAGLVLLSVLFWALLLL